MFVTVITRIKRAIVVLVIDVVVRLSVCIIAVYIIGVGISLMIDHELVFVPHYLLMIGLLVLGTCKLVISLGDVLLMLDQILIVVRVVERY